VAAAVLGFALAFMSARPAVYELQADGNEVDGAAGGDAGEDVTERTGEAQV
jgi:hypothetical protein